MKVPRYVVWMGLVVMCATFVMATAGLLLSMRTSENVKTFEATTIAEIGTIRTRLYILEASWILDPEGVAQALSAILASLPTEPAG